MNAEEILVSVFGGLCIVLAAVIPALINSRRAAKNAAIAKEHAETVAEQIVPSNGTKLHEYIERTDSRLDDLIQLVIEARDAANEARLQAESSATKTDMHEALFRHEPKE